MNNVLRRKHTHLNKLGSDHSQFIVKKEGRMTVMVLFSRGTHLKLYHHPEWCPDRVWIFQLVGS